MTRQEQLACLTDRPCAVCKYHSNNGCTQWKCVFEQEPDAIHNEREQAYMKGYEDASKRYRTEPCEDAISREWLKTAIHNFYYGLTHTPTEEDIQAYIDAAPSVSTEKTGRWIYDRTSDWEGFCKYECSECGMGSDVDYAYCMRCGAKMEVEE